MKLWFGDFTLEDLNLRGRDTMLEHVGIEFIDFGDDYIKARMPVDHRTKQTLGLLHGGASVVLAETLGSTAAYLCIDPEKQTTVGLDINANHIRTVTEGYVTGVTRPVHIGKRTQVWEIRIYDRIQKLVSISRITMAVLDK